MGNNESNDHRPVVSTLFVQNSITRYLQSDSPRSTKPRAEAAPFHPKLARSDTTTAQAGSPPRNLLDDEQSVNKKDPDISHSSANSSFPISESALPANFDTSGDFAPAELSHFFPLPPNKNDTSGSQKSFATASDSPSSPSLHKTSMASFNDPKDKKSLQETLDALWAPPKHVTVRVSAPNTPIAGPGDDLLIDFSAEPMPTMSSFPAVPALVSSTSADTSYDMKSSGASSANQSSEMRAPRTETLTQLLASHPELDFGSFESSPKHVKFQPNVVTGILLAGDDEPIKLPPVTYADATNIASKYPELAEKVLKEPIATPVQVHKLLEPEPEPEDEAGYFPDAQQAQEDPPAPDTSMKEPAPVMPEHTWDRPNWALAPATAEDYEPRPTRRPRPSYGDRDGDRGNSSYGSGGGGGGYSRRQSSGYAGGGGGGGGGGGRSYSPYQQDQNEFDAQWGSGGGSGGGGGDRSRGGDDRRGGPPPPRRNEQEDYCNARNGPQRRGWSQEPSFGGGRDGHDVPPHMRQGGGGRGGDDSYGRGGGARGGDDSYSRGGDDSYGGGDQRLPTRPSAPHADSWNASARVDEPASASAGGGGDVDDWSGTNRDAWGAPAPAAAAPEPKSDAWGAPAAAPAEPKQDAWGAPAPAAPAAEENRDAPPAGGDEWSGTERDAWGAPAPAPAPAPAAAEPKNDAWGALAAPVEPKQDVWGGAPAQQQQDTWGGAPAQEKPAETRAAPQAVEAVYEWEPTHDPWTAPAPQPTEARSASYSQAPAPAPAPPPPQSQSFREEAPRREETAPAANDWMANHDPWTSGGDENQNHGHQQSQKQLEPENKREAPSSIRGDAPSPFRDRMNDSNNSSYNRTPNRSVNEGSFSANVLDVRAPSQASVAALAASRGANASESRNDAPAELPVEFNYFLHSETADWLGSGPTNPSQNSFSPSQNLVTPARELTPIVRTPPRQRSPPVREREREISAPAPRNTDSFDYNQQPQDNGGDNWGAAVGGYAAPQEKENRGADSSNSFVLGSMKSDRYDCDSQREYQRGRSDSQWGPPDGENREREFNDGGRGGGRGRDGASPGYGGRRGGEDHGRRGDDEYGRRGEDERGRRGDDDYGRRGGDDYGRRGGDEEYGRRGGDDYGRRGSDDYGRRGSGGPGRHDDQEDYYNACNGPQRRGWSQEPNSGGGRDGRDYGGRRGDFDNRGPQNLNKYGGAGPLPGPYSGPPRKTSYGAKNFELPPLDDY